MKYFIAQILLSVTAAATVQASESVTCQQAMDAALKKYSPRLTYQSMRTTPIGNEGLVEATAVVFGWNPNSDAMSGYYYLVSATCQKEKAGLVLWSDLAPVEGGVRVKVITKQRY